MSPELQQFYNAYATWLNEGAPEDHPDFERHTGLCLMLEEWALNKGLSYSQVELLSDGLSFQFEKAGLCMHYPFGEGNYDVCLVHCTMHLDPLRTSWVYKHAEVLDERS